MKKRMLVLALAASLVAVGCVNNRGTGGAADQNERNSGFEQGFQNQYNPNVNSVGDPAEQQP